MSKYVKNLIADEIKRRLSGVESALVVDVIGLDSGKTSALRKRLRAKNMHLLVVKRSLAVRAAEGTALRPAFEGAEGSVAIVWGGEDIVALAKEITKLDGEKDYEKMKAKGGVLDGASLSPAQIKDVSKWPTRGEQLSLLVGQILGPGANLLAAILGPGATLGGQIKQKGEGEEAPAASG